MIIRNDDVNFNTSIVSLMELYNIINYLRPEAEIWHCVTLFAQSNKNGSVYADVPFKDKENDWFYKADMFMNSGKFIHHNVKVCSHGLYHVDHSKISYDAQEMSILGSCNYLKTDIFVPPFNKYNSDTADICAKNNILLVVKDGWKNFEYETFNPEHKNWYFHSWRFTPNILRKALRNEQYSVNLG